MSELKHDCEDCNDTGIIYGTMGVEHVCHCRVNGLDMSDAEVADMAIKQNAELKETIDAQAAEINELKNELAFQIRRNEVNESALSEKIQEVLRLTARVEELDKDLDSALEERDDREEELTNLSVTVGTYFGVDVGEWSNLNSPYEKALEILDGEYVTEQDREYEVLKADNARMREALEKFTCYPTTTPKLQTWEQVAEYYRQGIIKALEGEG